MRKPKGIKYPKINPPLQPEEVAALEASAPPVQVDKPLDTKALEDALKELHAHTEKRALHRHVLGNGEVFSKEFAVYLLAGEDQYLQSLKSTVASIIQGATRIV